MSTRRARTGGGVAATSAGLGKSCAVALWALFALSAGPADLHAQTPGKNGFDLSDSLVDPSQILRGGPPRDGIPSIDDPVFVPAAEAGLSDDARIIGVEIGGDARAYPISILNWHEIVNDVVGGKPIAVTFCPLCGTGVVFAAETGGRKLEFGVSGLLYNSDVLLYDRQSESLWSQVLAKAVTGERKGETLAVVPSRMTSWHDWRERHPDTAVLSERTGYARDYGRDPYAGYLESPEIFFPVAHTDSSYHPKEVVLGVEVGGQYKAYPASELEGLDSMPLVDEVNGTALTVSWDARSGSGSVAVAGGDAYPFIQGFWFAWYAFHPDTAVFGAPSR